MHFLASVQRFGLSIFMCLVLTHIAHADGLQKCKGKKVFACISLPKEVASRRKCQLYYQCQYTSLGEACFQCQRSIHILTRGLCEVDYKVKCAKADDAVGIFP